jgi:hypothetical protein
MDLSRLIPWARHREPPADLVAALGDLDQLAADRPALSRPAASLARLLVAAFGEPARDGPPTCPPEVLASFPAAWAEGRPLARLLPPELDDAALDRRARAVCEALRVDNPAAEPLSRRLRQDGVAAWCRPVLIAGPEAIVERAEAAGLDPALAGSVLRLVLLPTLARWTAALVLLHPEGAWPFGHCPHCGSPPLLGESRGLEGRRFLRCGWCAADWPTERLRCPHCGTSDPALLHYSFAEGEESRHRLAHCDACGLSLKVVSTLSPLSAPGLLVAELSMVHLDLAASNSTEGGPT